METQHATTPSRYTFLSPEMHNTDPEVEKTPEPSETTVAAEDATAAEQECPCVTRLRQGVCGDAFSAAYDCYVRSTEPEKGSECVQYFIALSECARNNPGSFDLDSPDMEEAMNPQEPQQQTSQDS